MLPRVAVIGSGNLAWHLAPALDRAGYAVQQVYSRHTDHARALAQRLRSAETSVSLDFSATSSRIFLVAVADDALAEVARCIVLPSGALLLHASGSLSLDVLAVAQAEHTGVFYPLQTFSKARNVSFNGLPILWESRTKEAEKQIVNMAEALGAAPRKTTSEERKAIHVAAVFASNFINHMLALGNDVLRRHRIDLDMLRPLAVETLSKGFALGPRQAQTGPAARRDRTIIAEHLTFLKPYPAVAKVYDCVTRSLLQQR